MYDMLIQGIGLIAFALFLLSYQVRSNRGLFAMQTAGNFLFALQFFLLGGVGGAAGSLISCFRNSLLLGRKKLLSIFRRRKVKDFLITFTKKSHFADFLTKHTLDFVLHCLLGGLAEMHTDDIGGLADLLSDSRARGVVGDAVGCGIVHAKSSCK